MKLWNEHTPLDEHIERFTIGSDQHWDLELAAYDVIGSIAHARMLHACGLLDSSQEKSLVTALRTIHRRIVDGAFVIGEGVEDVHSQVELELTRMLGETGKRIHTARSRNDQALLDIRLYLCDRIRGVVERVATLFDVLISLSEKSKHILLPGYTHFQPAMPSSFGLWFGAYAESLIDDIIQLHAAYRIADKNPLGSVAGYGSTFPINRRMTTALLGFEDLNYNSLNAQMGRGKTERVTSHALASVASTLARLAMDVCLFSSPNFGFLRLPADATTGSSIMPHKKNPDVFELVRARCNKLQALPNDVVVISTNLPSGYHRDYQILKELLFPAFSELFSCLDILALLLPRMELVDGILDDPRYAQIRSVERIESLVKQGVAFRDAYRIVAEEIHAGIGKETSGSVFTHEGSIVNLCNDDIVRVMKNALDSFPFSKRDEAVSKLLGE